MKPPPGTHITVVTSLVAEFLKELPGSVLHSAEVDSFLAAGRDISKLHDAIGLMAATRRSLMSDYYHIWTYVL